MGKGSLGCSIGIATDIPDRQLVHLESILARFIHRFRRRDKEISKRWEGFERENVMEGPGRESALNEITYV